MNIDILLSCTIKILEILIKKYELGELDINELKSNCHIKVKFIEDSLSLIQLEEEKNSAYKVLENYYKILSNSHTHF